MLLHVLSLLSLAQTAQPEIPTEPAPPPVVQAAPAAQARPNPLALAQYNAKRGKTPRTADAQWKLALWCEDHGLEPEAKAALAIVVELEPSKDAAWKRLGCQKYHGQWMTLEQIERAKVQEAADKRWAAEFKAIHRHIHGGKRQEEARAALAKVDDPRAIPALYREFADRSPVDQLLAIQILGQIRSSVSSKSLAALSVYGVSTEVRRLATETLRGRDPSEYAGFLVSLLAEVLRYEVRPVAGPGSPGILYVEGQRFGVRRFYAPPAAPNLGYQPGDTFGLDPSGNAVLLRPTGTLSSSGSSKLNGDLTTTTITSRVIGEVAISPRMLQNEAIKGAVSAERQLENDLAALQSQNQLRKSFNDLVTRVLEDATGEQLGNDPEAWKTYARKLVGYGKTRPETPAIKPVFDQLVPIAYHPRFQPEYFTAAFLKTTYTSPPDT